ncbi:MAG TPA: DUF1622 domain-containing protein [Sandaracinaceae bacterium]
MEEVLQNVAGTVALLLESATVVMISIGSVAAVVRLAAGLRLTALPGDVVREAWLHLARWLLLALELMLAADLVRSAVAPTWDDIGKLAAIAGIRTVLGFFLGRDLETEHRLASARTTEANA